MTDDLTGLRRRAVPAGPRLHARMPDGPAWETTLDPGEATLVDHPDPDRVVAFLLGAPGAGAARVGRRGRGVLRVDGRRLDRRGPATRVRHGLVAVSGAVVAPDVTVHDHLAAVIGGAAPALLATSPLLRHRGPDPAGVLSGGERRTLAWLRARALAPAVVVLDRAAEGFDATSLAWAGALVAGWRDAGVAIVVRAGRDEEAGWAAHDR